MHCCRVSCKELLSETRMSLSDFPVEYFSLAYITSWRSGSFGLGFLDAVEEVIGFVQVIFDRAFDLVRFSAKICWN